MQSPGDKRNLACVLHVCREKPVMIGPRSLSALNSVGRCTPYLVANKRRAQRWLIPHLEAVHLESPQRTPGIHLSSTSVPAHLAHLQGVTAFSTLRYYSTISWSIPLSSNWSCIRGCNSGCIRGYNWCCNLGCNFSYNSGCIWGCLPPWRPWPQSQSRALALFRS